MLKLAVLGSTRGTDLDAIVSAIDEGILNATIKLVISNKENAYILKRAEKNDIKSMFLSDNSVTREEYGNCLLYTSPSPRDVEESRMPSSA